MDFNSRRSPVYSRHGMVASSQPLATEVGLRILKAGGNAADAAVAVAAALNVTQPTSTGIGGDCFALFFDSKTKQVRGLNGSGRAPAALSLDRVQSFGYSESNPWGEFSPLTITVPGAAAGWVDTVDKFGSGKLTLMQILQPAIDLAEEGFPVSDICAHSWAKGAPQLKNGPYSDEMLLNGQAPKAGEVMKLPTLAQTFRELGKHGKAGFYQGRVAESMVAVIRKGGGVLTLEDLKSHQSTFLDPIHVNYRGVDIYEIPPNGQGITALMALNLLKGFDLSKYKHNSAEHLHLVIEALRISFADSRWYVTDPEHAKVPVEGMLSDKYADERRKLISPHSVASVVKGFPDKSSCTVYFCVVDGEGNACSFINSNYNGFGTGIIPKGCGFTLQNRGHNFSLDPAHPNAVAPGKRPYHTIIPGMAVKDGELYCPFGVMGGFNQPQGHVQVICNLLDFKMNPQQALDALRIQVANGDQFGHILIEDGIPQSVVDALAEMGHHSPTVVSGFARSTFGVGQIIVRDPKTGVLCAGSDPRHDGCAMGW